MTDQTQQRERVGGDPGRVATAERFPQDRERLSRADLLLSGGEGAVADAAEAVCRILRSRGGMLTRELLAPLLGAGSVPTGAHPASLKSASYDLGVGDEVWCAGFRT